MRIKKYIPYLVVACSLLLIQELLRQKELRAGHRFEGPVVVDSVFVISGLVGLVPRLDDRIEVDSLLPDGQWDWFCLDRVPCRGNMVTILWDKDGTGYNREEGLQLFVDGKKAAGSPQL